MESELDSIRNPFGDRPLGRVGLLLCGQGDPNNRGAVVLRRVDCHGAPPTTNVEEPHAGLKAELACDEVDLVLLRLLQRVVRRLEDGARVGHRGAQDQLVEAVRDVVVV